MTSSPRRPRHVHGCRVRRCRRSPWWTRSSTGARRARRRPRRWDPTSTRLSCRRQKVPLPPRRLTVFLLESRLESMPWKLFRSAHWLFRRRTTTDLLGGRARGIVGISGYGYEKDSVNFARVSEYLGIYGHFYEDSRNALW